MPIRAHAAAVACVLGGMLAGASRPAFGQMAPFPGPLEAMTLFEQIERRAPGALDLDAWFEIERCLEHADAQIAARFVPRLIELDRIATAQSWLNWPSIKPKAVRELRDHCVDLEIEIDREFFQCAIEALARRTRSSQATGAPGSAEEGAGGGAPDSVEDSPLVRAIRSVERRRIRELLPPWPLLDAAPVDLDRIAARQLAPLDLGDDARLAIARELESWEQSRATECLAQRASRRDAFDRFEALLLEQGVDLAELDDPGGAWMVAAFDAWSRVGESLEMSVRAMIERDRRAMTAIAAHLPEAAASAWIDAVLSSCHRLSGQDNRAFAGDDFARAIRVKGLPPETRERILKGRRRWSTADAAIVRRWCDSMLANAPLYCPLTYLHWGPDERYASFKPLRLELDHDRMSLADAAIAELRAELGASAAILDDGVEDGDDRLEPLPTPPADAIGWRNPDDEGWSPRPDATVFAVSRSATGWFDPGAIDERDLERLLRWFDLGEHASSSLAMLHRDRTLEFAERWTPRSVVIPYAIGEGVTGWRFEPSNYRYDKASADLILSRSIERADRLREFERELWDAALRFASSDEQRRRIRLAAVARDLEVALAPYRAALVEEWYDRRGEVTVPAALLGASLLAFDEALRSSPTPMRDAEDRLLRSFEGRFDPLVASVQRRLEASGPAARHLVRFRDEMMWAGNTARPRLEREIRRLRETDDPLRGHVVRAQEALIDEIEQEERAGSALARETRRVWSASAFAPVHGREPSIMRAIEADAAKPSPIREQLLELGRWHETRDAPLAQAAVELCIEARLASRLEAPPAQDIGQRLRSLATQRREAGQRAEIRRRLLWRSVGVETAAPASPK